MKIREGFVSNSSSSSFIVAAKGAINKQRLIDILGVPKTSPLYKFAQEVADVLASAQPLEDSDLAERIEDGDTKLVKLLKQGFDLYEGSASDEGTEAAEYALCFMDINYKSDDLVIIKEGGY